MDISGRTFRLKGKGFPAKSGRGDLLATVRIVLPEKSDPELEELMKKWQSDKPYDPRKDMELTDSAAAGINDRPVAANRQRPPCGASVIDLS